MNDRIIVHPPKKEKDGTFTLTVSYYLNEKRKQKRKKQIRSSKEAKRIGEQIKAQLEKDLPILEATNGEKVTFTVFATEYLESRKGKKGWAYNTYRSYLNALNKWPYPNKYIDEVQPWEIEEAILHLLETYAHSTVTTYVTYWVSLFNVALKRKRILINPASTALIPKQSDTGKRVKALTLSEAAGISNKIANQQLHLAVLIGYTCGLRIGEIADLNVLTDIDFTKGVINVSHQRQLSDGKYQRQRPLKTKNSYRTVPIPPSTLRAIREYPMRTIDGYLFTMTPQSLSRGFGRAAAKQGYSETTFHCLRHTYVTGLIRSRQFDIQSIASLAGDSVPVILKTYSHYLDEAKAENAEKINLLFC